MKSITGANSMDDETSQRVFIAATVGALAHNLDWVVTRM